MREAMRNIKTREGYDLRDKVHQLRALISGAAVKMKKAA